VIEVLTSEYAPIFTIPAIAGSFFFVARLVLMLFGAAGGEDMGGEAFDAGHDLGGADGAGVHDHHHGDSTQAFKVLSLQSIAGFVMGFGWGGLGAYRGMEWPVTTSLLCAIAGGVLIVWLLTNLLRSMSLLHASGNISIESAVGCTGSVYVGIPARGAGRGKVRLLVEERARIYNAVSSGGELPRGSRVKVVLVNRDNTVTVAPEEA
jgi:uncharacterized membrane protein